MAGAEFTRDHQRNVKKVSVDQADGYNVGQQAEGFGIDLKETPKVETVKTRSSERKHQTPSQAKSPWDH